MKSLMDYSAIGDTLIKNNGMVHQNFMAVGLLGASKEMPYKLDVDKAKALLAKAGLPNGFKVTIDMRTTQPVQGITEASQQTAKRAGIDIESAEQKRREAQRIKSCNDVSASYMFKPFSL